MDLTECFSPEQEWNYSLHIDNRKTKAVTIWESYPRSCMDECTETFGDATVFSTLNTTSTYRHVKIANENPDLTTFTSHHGLFNFTCMSFRFNNAPGTSPGANEVLLTKIKWQLALVYLEEAEMFLRTPGQHINHVPQVLTLLDDADDITNETKFEMF